MRQILKSFALVSAFFIFASCSSDDSNNPGPDKPEITESQYFINTIERKMYDGTPSVLLMVNTLEMVYDDENKLKHILYKEDHYKNDEIAVTYNSTMDYVLNKEDQLQFFGIKNNNAYSHKYSYSYINNLLSSADYNLVSQKFTFNSTFTHNEKGQMIKNDTPLANLLVDYSYNSKNQINAIKLNGQNNKITYDNQTNPFANLPLDLTGFLMGYDYVFPYSYTFPHNITSIESNSASTTIEYTYNDAKLPVHAKRYYKDDKTAKVLPSEITYSYHHKEDTK
ncbi:MULTISPECIES: hypothetical protein [unclassified Myroides]|uniref:hypothetical protein n=1 Tax=unclassified Myroides TaxID=2642485 RepID=UPI003D2F6D3A